MLGSILVSSQSITVFVCKKNAPNEKAWYLQMEASTWNSKIWTMAVRLYQSQQRSKTSVLAADQRQFRSRTCLAVSSTATSLGSVGFAVSCQRRVIRFGNWMNWMDLWLAWNSAVASRPSKLSLTHTSYKRADLWRTEFLSLLCLLLFGQSSNPFKAVRPKIQTAANPGDFRQKMGSVASQHSCGAHQRLNKVERHVASLNKKPTKNISSFYVFKRSFVQFL